MIVAVVNEVTVLVATVKVAFVDPAGTVTVDGRVAEALLLDRAIDMPPDGAAAFRITVPVEEFPPVTDVGLSDAEESAMPVTMVSDAVRFTPL